MQHSVNWKTVGWEQLKLNLGYPADWIIVADGNNISVCPVDKKVFMVIIPVSELAKPFQLEDIAPTAEG